MNKINVCIVEDIPEIRSELEKIVESDTELLLLGSYSSGEDALEVLADSHANIVIMDINLPGIDGISCVKKIAPLRPDMQFMMFTIYENSEQVFEALSAGASGYLLKNTDAATIAASIKELHQGGSPMSSHIARKVVGSFKKAPEVTETSTVLSERENEVLDQLAKGFLYKEIAEKLAISTGTVRQHIHKIYKKLHVQNRTEALNKVYGNPGR